LTDPDFEFIIMRWGRKVQSSISRYYGINIEVTTNLSIYKLDGFYEFRRRGVVLPLEDSLFLYLNCKFLFKFSVIENKIQFIKLKGFDKRL
jgi:hypothetical protein